MLDKIVHYATNFDLSDIHIHSDEPMAIRTSGEIEMQKDDMIARKDVEAFLDEILDEEQKEHFNEWRDVDLAIDGGNMRFRVNAYQTINGPNIVLRKIETEIPDVNDLGVPEVIMNIAKEKNGLMLVTGPTGSGKSTTLAAIINEINKTRKDNIITIEDPIEFVHTTKTSLISQREVGKDAKSFASGLKAMLREDPDVILVGEMRDLETVGLALTAAETGHLVFGTLHTNGAPNSINRILDVFPPEQQAQARSQLSQSLRMVVTQRLLKKIGGGRAAAFEIMVNNVAIANLIRESKIFQISQAMQTGKKLGMITMEESVESLVKAGLVTQEEADGEQPLCLQEDATGGGDGSAAAAPVANPAANPAAAQPQTPPTNQPNGGGNPPGRTLNIQ